MKRETEAGKLIIELTPRDIRQTLIKTTRNSGKKTPGHNPDFQQTYLKQIVIQLAINSGKSLLSQFRLTQQIIEQRKQARAEYTEIW